MNEYEGTLAVADARFGIVAGRFNSFIVTSLIDGAVNTLKRHGCDDDDIDIYRVPGAFEIPLMAKCLAVRGGYNGLLAIGAVVRGSTPHFNYVAGECVKGIAAISLEYSIPIAFGVLTVDTLEQAIERAGTKGGNKGCEAALSVIEMVNIMRQTN